MVATFSPQSQTHSANNRWQQESPLTARTLQQVLNNQISGLVVDYFLSARSCAILAQKLNQLELRQTYDRPSRRGATPTLNQFVVQTDYQTRSTHDYFARAAKAYTAYGEMVAKTGVDPASELVDVLQQVTQTPVELAEQAGQRYFFLAAQKRYGSSQLSANFAPYLSSHWSISHSIVAQLTWILYLEAPVQGGPCVVYDRPWVREDEQWQLSLAEGYDPAVVVGCRSTKFQPQLGRLVLFNSRNFHEVKATTHPRWELTGQIGLTKDGRLLMWA
jgi:2OG-Fe(II) oxygenase superfamily